MLRQCWWRGEQINCSEIFTPVITDTGVCCAFNLQTHFKESNYSQLVKEMQVAKIANLRFVSVRWKLELLQMGGFGKLLPGQIGD